MFRPLLAALLLSTPISAQTLRFVGVLGNSGEQGSTLVRFSGSPASGLGVAYDRFGSLWDRGGNASLNRYAPDGRLLASYPLPKVRGSLGDVDSLVLLGDTLLLKLDNKLYSLPVDGPAGTAPASLNIQAMRLSLGSHDGWAVASAGRKIFLVNACGETRHITEAPDLPHDVEAGPEGGIYARLNPGVFRLDSTAAPAKRGPWTSPGERLQFLGSHWFGSASHGTIRRFDTSLDPDPGVVLGGASGFFIGYVEGNYDVYNNRGLAYLGGSLFAASGIEGVLNLLEWDAAKERLTPIRRIGSLISCQGLALDAEGRIWQHSGIWQWTDDPAAPRRLSVSPADTPGSFPAVLLNQSIAVLPGIRNGKPVIHFGPLTDPLRISENAATLPRDTVATALINTGNRPTLIALPFSGKGRAILLNGNGEPAGDGGEFTLPLQALTSLSSNGSNTLFAAADGQVVELHHLEGQWKEIHRWKSWDAEPDASFGPTLHLCYSQGRLWISDSARHRVLCFDAVTRKLLASFGSPDLSGDSLSTLNNPQVITANGDRAIFFDAANQRLIRLEFAP